MPVTIREYPMWDFRSLILVGETSDTTLRRTGDGRSCHSLRHFSIAIKMTIRENCGNARGTSTFVAQSAEPIGLKCCRLRTESFHLTPGRPASQNDLYLCLMPPIRKLSGKVRFTNASRWSFSFSTPGRPALRLH